MPRRSWPFWNAIRKFSPSFKDIITTASTVNGTAFTISR